MPHKSKTTQALQHMNNALKSLGFYKEGKTHDPFQYNLDYTQRVFDTIARMLQIVKPCCAVYPELTPNKDGTFNIETLYVSFNSNLKPEAQKQVSHVFEVITQATDDSIPPDARLDALVQTVMLHSNYYHNGRSPKWFAMHKLGTQIADHVLMAQKIYSDKLPKLNTQLDSIKALEGKVRMMSKQDLATSNIELELYYEYMNLCTQFFANDVIQVYLTTDVDPAARESLYNTIYYPYRLYADCKKLIELMPQMYNMYKGEVVILDNPDNAHAELVILEHFKLSPDHHIGISKLCCAQCYAIFGYFQKQGYFKEDIDVVLGSHGFSNLTTFKTGALVDALSPDEQIEFMHMLMKCAPQNAIAPKFVEQNSYLSDDEELFNTNDPYFVSVKYLYALLNGSYVQKQSDKKVDMKVKDKKFDMDPPRHYHGDEIDDLSAVGAVPASHSDARTVSALNLVIDAKLVESEGGDETPPAISPQAEDPTTEEVILVGVNHVEETI